MANFSHLDALQVKQDGVARYTFHNIVVNEKSPTLIVRPATQANKPYFKELFRRQEARARQIAASKRIDPKFVDDTRDEDRDLFPKFVVTGWEDMIDADGGEVVFSVDECRQFLEALPDWVVDDFFQWCKRNENFVEGVALDTRDVEGTAKN